jgi:glycosyltransferase involved in cell wall biosynthesis
MGGNQHGGIGRYAFELLLHLLERDQTNRYIIFYHPSLVSQSDLETIRNFKNAELVASHARHYSFGEQILFLRQLYAYPIDVMHFPNFNIPIRYSRPFVTTIHDVVHHKISGQKKSTYWKFLAYKKVIETAAKNAAVVITVSQASKDDIHTLLQVPTEKIEVIYEGVTLNTVEDKKVQMTKRKFLLERPYFLFVGTLERKKNVVTLARAFDLFLAKYKLDMDLVFAGKVDTHYPDIKFQAMDIAHANRLVFTDYISDNDLSALYQGALAYVNASLHEGFGLPGVEAMRFGLPLAVSNLPVFNEIYDNAALYFDPQNTDDIAEKLYLLAKDPQFHAQMQQKSLARAEFFDWNSTAEQTLAVYESVNAKAAQQKVSDRTPIRE